MFSDEGRNVKLWVAVSAVVVSGTVLAVCVYAGGMLQEDVSRKELNYVFYRWGGGLMGGGRALLVLRENVYYCDRFLPSMEESELEGLARELSREGTGSNENLFSASSPLRVGEMDGILEKINSGFLELEGRYGAPVMDLPGATITVSYGGNTKSVTDYGGAPRAFQAVQEELSDIMKSRGWGTSAAM